MFKQTARLWSHVYAGAPVSSPEYTRKIDKLCSMGFEKVSISQTIFLTCCALRGWILLQNKTYLFPLQNAVIVALSSKSWDVETATELLLSNWILTLFIFLLSPISPPHTYTPCSRFLLSQGVSPPIAPSVLQWTPHLHTHSSSTLPRLPSVWHISPPSPLPTHHLCCTTLQSVAPWAPINGFFKIIQHSTQRYNQKSNHITPPYLEANARLKTPTHPRSPVSQLSLAVSKKRLSAANPCLCSAYTFICGNLL